MIPTGDEPLFGGKKRQKPVQTGTGKIKHGGMKVNRATQRLTDATAAGVCVCVVLIRLSAVCLITTLLIISFSITTLFFQGLVAPLRKKGSSPKTVSSSSTHKILPLSFKRFTEGSYLLGVSHPLTLIIRGRILTIRIL